MSKCIAFPVIDLSATGRSIEQRRKAAGLSVRDVQAYFGFEYPQAVYKWQHGDCLPSVDNLLALSHLLRVPMEDLLVYEDREVSYFLAAKQLLFSFLKGTNFLQKSGQWPPPHRKYSAARRFACIRGRRSYAIS